MAEFHAKILVKVKKHDAEHFNSKSIDTMDSSCLTCHPVRTQVDDKFKTFIAWYKEFMPMRLYTEVTILLFGELLEEDFGDKGRRDRLRNKLWSLVESMRYINQPQISDGQLIAEIIFMFFYSKNFTLNISEAKKAIEEARKSNPTTQENTPEEILEEGRIQTKD